MMREPSVPMQYSTGPSGDLLSQFLNHAMQMCGRTFNIKVLVLSCAALRGKQCTAVHLLEISVRKFVVLLRIFGFLVVDSQMPLPIFAEPVGVDKLVFFLSGWLVLAPCVSFVHYDFSFADKFFGILECIPVQFHCHTYLLSAALARDSYLLR